MIRSSSSRWSSPNYPRGTFPRAFVSEATVYRLLKADDLITNPAHVVIKAADRCHTQTTGRRDVADRLHLLQDHSLGISLSTILDGGRLAPGG